MSQETDTQAPTDPFAVLGVSASAAPDVVRARYLELVKQYSPESAPEKFQQIRRAYEAASDPLQIAKNLIGEAPSIETWQSVLDRQRAHPPRIATELLLSLGNKQTGSTK